MYILDMYRADHKKKLDFEERATRWEQKIRVQMDDVIRES